MLRIKTREEFLAQHSEQWLDDVGWKGEYNKFLGLELNKEAVIAYINSEHRNKSVRLSKELDNNRMLQPEPSELRGGWWAYEWDFIEEPDIEF